MTTMQSVKEALIPLAKLVSELDLTAPKRAQESLDKQAGPRYSLRWRRFASSPGTDG